MDNKVYLGDGVYAECDGFHICLSVYDDYEREITIYLEDTVFQALLDFAKKIYWLDDPKEENN